VRLDQPGLILALAALTAAVAGCGGEGVRVDSTLSDVPTAPAPTVAGSGPAAECARAWNAEENREGQVGLAQWLGVPGLAVHIGRGARGCQLILHDESGGQQVWHQSGDDKAFVGPEISSGGENILHPLDVTAAGYVQLSSAG
jgi:hypothetical protein